MGRARLQHDISVRAMLSYTVSFKLLWHVRIAGVTIWVFSS